MPALRAVFDGMNGDSTRSDSATAYPSPSVRDPSLATSVRAIRRPSPVTSYPSANVVAENTSQTTSLLNPDSAQRIDSAGVSFDQAEAGADADADHADRCARQRFGDETGDDEDEQREVAPGGRVPAPLVRAERAPARRGQRGTSHLLSRIG